MEPSVPVTILCLPGLGGHPSAFKPYAGFLSEYDLRYIELVDRRKALASARAILAAENGPAVLLCNCYSAQMGIQLAADMPDKVRHLIFLEPFFVEFQPWLRLLLPLNVFFLATVNFFGMLGIRRRQLDYQPDYAALAKYPIYIQPLFDMRWQDLGDYLDKCWDILTYKLPPRVSTPTTMLFSPQGFSRSTGTKDKLRKIFTQAHIIEMPNGTHNIITMGGAPVAAAVRRALNIAS